MNEQPVYLTQEGYETLENELHHLKTVRRKQVAERLHNALTEGELIENAELEEARREQSFVEGRIMEIQNMLRHAVIIEKSAETGLVTLGADVTVKEAGSDTLEEYQVVGSAEANPAKGKISNESPLGKALMGKKVGEQATIHAPGGDITFEIIAIH